MFVLDSVIVFLGWDLIGDRMLFELPIIWIHGTSEVWVLIPARLISLISADCRVTNISVRLSTSACLVLCISGL